MRLDIRRTAEFNRSGIAELVAHRICHALRLGGQQPTQHLVHGVLRAIGLCVGRGGIEGNPARPATAMLHNLRLESCALRNDVVRGLVGVSSRRTGLKCRVGCSDVRHVPLIFCCEN